MFEQYHRAFTNVFVYKLQNVEKKEDKKTHEAETHPMIVCEVKKSVPRVRPRKKKEKIKMTSVRRSSTAVKDTTTCVTSGNTMKLHVNLMPVLASAKEPVEEEQEKEDENFPTVKEPKFRSKKEPSFPSLGQQTLKSRHSQPVSTSRKGKETDQPLTPGLVLPPVPQPKPALGLSECCNCQENTGSFTHLPAIRLPETTTKTLCPNFTANTKAEDEQPWLKNPLFSRSRSAEFCLPEIPLSSLDALLQTVTQKLASKRRDIDDGPWRRVRSNRLLQPLREKVVGEQGASWRDEASRDNIAAATGASLHGQKVGTDTNLPASVSQSKPTLILSMTNKAPRLPTGC